MLIKARSWSRFYISHITLFFLRLPQYKSANLFFWGTGMLLNQPPETDSSANQDWLAIVFPCGLDASLIHRSKNPECFLVWRNYQQKITDSVGLLKTNITTWGSTKAQKTKHNNLGAIFCHSPFAHDIHVYTQITFYNADTNYVGIRNIPANINREDTHDW